MDIREFQLIAIELETKFLKVIFHGKRSINWNLIFIAFHFWQAIAIKLVQTLSPIVRIGMALAAPYTRESPESRISYVL